MAQFEERLFRQQEVEAGRHQPMSQATVPVEVEIEKMEQERFEDPLKKLLRQERPAHFKSLSQALRAVHRCRFPAPANRFGLEPGFVWDGVDRSNGYELRYLEKLNQLKAQSDQDYISHAAHL